MGQAKPASVFKGMGLSTTPVNLAEAHRRKLNNESEPFDKKQAMLDSLLNVGVAMMIAGGRPGEDTLSTFGVGLQTMGNEVASAKAENQARAREAAIDYAKTFVGKHPLEVNPLATPEEIAGYEQRLKQAINQHISKSSIPGLQAIPMPPNDNGEPGNQLLLDEPQPYQGLLSLKSVPIV